MSYLVHCMGVTCPWDLMHSLMPEVIMVCDSTYGLLVMVMDLYCKNCYVQRSHSMGCTLLAVY